MRDKNSHKNDSYKINIAFFPTKLLLETLAISFRCESFYSSYMALGVRGRGEGARVRLMEGNGVGTMIYDSVKLY